MNIKQYDDYAIEIIKHNGTIIIWNDSYKMKYIGYTINEAIQLFKRSNK